MIPFVDLKAQYQTIKNEIGEAVNQVLDQTNFILGDPVAKFEEEFAQFCQVKYCLGVASGTDALHLALRALEIGSGDEVIIPANTFVATALAVSYTGATPILVDADPENFNLDLNKIEEKITAKTKAIIPVHLYGRPMDMDKLITLAQKYNLQVVEDACQAHGATWKNKKVGSFGIIGCFSFYPGKNLGAYGDGGAIVTNDEALAEKLKMLRNYGSPKKYYHDTLGYNSRLDTLQAAILRVKLKYLPDWNNQRLGHAKLYNEKLTGVGDLILPSIDWANPSVFHLYVVRTKKRDALLKYLSDHGVQTGIHYPVPLYSLGAYKHLNRRPEDFPITEQLSQEILSLPMFAELNEEQIDIVVNLIKQFFQPAINILNNQGSSIDNDGRDQKIKLGLIGYGYWGPNFARTIKESTDCELKYCADTKAENLTKIKEKYPQTVATLNYQDILADPEVKAVVIVTPTKTHFEIAKNCLLAGKHVLVEKPLCYTSWEARELINIADERGLTLMVGHIFLFNPAVRYIKELIINKEIGQLRHLHLQRRNLGPIRQDVNVLWDLAPHDVVMALNFINETPISVVASGESFLPSGLYDVVSASIKFSNNIIANIILSWIDPIKMRDVTIVGDKKMILFDDVNPSEKIKIFNKNIDVVKKATDANFGEYQIILNSNEISIPAIANINKEPLKEEFSHFIDCLTTGQRPISDGENGLAVVKILEAIQKSLDNNSQSINI